MTDTDRPKAPNAAAIQAIVAPFIPALAPVLHQAAITEAALVRLEALVGRDQWQQYEDELQRRAGMFAAWYKGRPHPTPAPPRAMAADSLARDVMEGRLL